MDPLDGDSDGDGLPDGADVEFIENAINALPPSAFKPPGGGTRKAMLAVLTEIESRLADGDTAAAVDGLTTLRSRTDGCGSVPARDDWIKDCAAQQSTRTLLDLLLANIAS